MGDVDAEIEEAQRSRGKGLAVADASDEFYGGSGMDGMADSIDAGPEEEDEGGDDRPQKRQSFTAPRHLLDVPQQQDEETLLRQTEYAPMSEGQTQPQQHAPQSRNSRSMAGRFDSRISGTR